MTEQTSAEIERMEAERKCDLAREQWKKEQNAQLIEATEYDPINETIMNEQREFYLGDRDAFDKKRKHEQSRTAETQPMTFLEIDGFNRRKVVIQTRAEFEKADEKIKDARKFQRISPEMQLASKKLEDAIYGVAKAHYMWVPQIARDRFIQEDVVKATDAAIKRLRPTHAAEKEKE